ncbi:nucleotidyltransferase family protein [Telmatobacter sp. DSM 110680]|uniref:Nucleotidyltransferase family protein n=1 Tax=Telmatobacter sp. DSM 110680 TaxID=3036704 RepID=A0AAU7DST8_9BACT
MVLAAGLGTRLRPLTDYRPKALVEVGGRTLLEITLTRLRSFGISEVIINTHYFADMVVEYLRAHQNFGMHIELSYEHVLLDTGGGIKHAAHFFVGLDEPFLVHNVDVLSTIDFSKMLVFHRERNALATLAVQDRYTSRYLLFDQNGELCGRRKGVDGVPELVREVEKPQARAFAGIHILSPRIFSSVEEQGIFSIIPVYLRLAAGNKPIAGFPADGYYWRDMGRSESIVDAERDIAQNAYPGVVSDDLDR